MRIRFDPRNGGDSITTWYSSEVVPMPGDLVRLEGVKYRVFSRYIESPTAMRVSVSPIPIEQPKEGHS